MTKTAATPKVTVYIGLGSNLGDRREMLESALRALEHLPETTLKGRSGWFENPAVGIPGGGDFLNAAVCLETSLSPRDLLDQLLRIECEHGRLERSQDLPDGTYASRPLDLDILFYGNRRLREKGLVVPHPRMTEREFVIVPLRELGVEVSEKLRDIESGGDNLGC